MLLVSLCVCVSVRNGMRGRESIRGSFSFLSTHDSGGDIAVHFSVRPSGRLAVRPSVTFLVVIWKLHWHLIITTFITFASFPFFLTIFFFLNFFFFFFLIFLYLSLSNFIITFFLHHILFTDSQHYGGSTHARHLLFTIGDNVS